MKSLKFVFTVMILLGVVFNGLAQENEMKYIFSGKDKVKISGFVAPIMEFSAMGSDFAFFMGGGGAMLINQKVFFGAYGEGLTTRYLREISYYNEVNSVKLTQEVDFGHGGLWAGYIYKSRLPIHAGISTRLGWGTINPWDEDYKPNHSSDFNDHVFVAIPQLEAEFNFFKWMKINVGVGYRFVTGIDKKYAGTDELIYDKKDFSKPQATMTVMFGFFK